MKKRLTKSAIVFCLVFLLPASLAAELWEADLSRMKTAFINGYFRALCLDEKTIARLKKSKAAMKKHIRAKAREYIDEVRKLNR